MCFESNNVLCEPTFNMFNKVGNDLWWPCSIAYYVQSQLCFVLGKNNFFYIILSTYVCSYALTLHISSSAIILPCHGDGTCFVIDPNSAMSPQANFLLLT